MSTNSHLRGLGSEPNMANAFLASRLVPWLGLLGLCGAYLQGGVMKAADFTGAQAELAALGLPWPGAMAVATILLELGASLLILTGQWRWLGALALAGFTVLANFLANRFWSQPPSAGSAMMNAFFEHLGLAGAFVIVAWHDLRGIGPGERT